MCYKCYQNTEKKYSKLMSKIRLQGLFFLYTQGNVLIPMVLLFYLPDCTYGLAITTIHKMKIH